MLKLKRFSTKNKYFYSNITTALTSVVVMLFLFITSCSQEKKNTISSFPDRSKIPILRTTNVTTMISDSGITRYRIHAPEWSIYDKAAEPYWDFPKGILFERFNGEYQTDAHIQSDQAIFYTKQNLWKLTGNVKAQNMEGETFQTQLLFWDQKKKEIFSDSTVTITQKDKIISGRGFESDQTMSKYKILKVNGIIPIKEETE